jgi:hypothetical protein
MDLFALIECHVTVFINIGQAHAKSYWTYQTQDSSPTICNASFDNIIMYALKA